MLSNGVIMNRTQFWDWMKRCSVAKSNLYTAGGVLECGSKTVVSLATEIIIVRFRTVRYVFVLIQQCPLYKTEDPKHSFDEPQWMRQGLIMLSICLTLNGLFPLWEMDGYRNLSQQHRPKISKNCGMLLTGYKGCSCKFIN